MKNSIKIWWIDWIHMANPSVSDVEDLDNKYNLHELVYDDLIELNSQDKIDVYDNCLSIALHFPKFDPRSQRYILNELNVVLGKDFIITATRLLTNHIENLRTQYKADSETFENDEEYKITTYFMLYQIIDNLYDKTLRILSKFYKDLVVMEEELFAKNQINSKTITNILIKKRNISYLKHIYSTQWDVISELNEILPKFYEDELSVYFEDLNTKRQKIISNIINLQENVDSIADTYNNLMAINTNNTILILTIFTWLMLPLTFLTGLYGMNVPLPGHESSLVFWWIIVLLAIFGWVFGYIFYKEKFIR